MATDNTFNGDLFPRLDGAVAVNPPANVIPLKVGGEYIDLAPYTKTYLALGAMVQQFSKNPYDARQLVAMQKLASQVRPALNRALQDHPAVRQIAHPMVQAMSSYLQSSQSLIKMRLRTSYQIARAPKILVPISMSIAAGGTLTGVQVRNPYLGASGGMTGQYQSPWAITSFRTSNGESGALLPIRITQFLLGGHDFVAAALAGLTYTAGGAPATQGWGAGAFAETKRGNWKTEVQPWNVVASHGGGTGFGSVMTETGFLQIGVFNGGAQTYVDTYSVYCNATLCGSPFANAAYTQVDAFRKSFAPLALQAPLSLALAGAADSHLDQALDADDPRWTNEPNSWMGKVRDFGGFIDRLTNTPGGFDHMAVGTDFLDPSGMSLVPGAEYVAR